VPADVLSSAASFGQAKGRMSKNAATQRIWTRAAGGMSSTTARPTTAFPAQNSDVSVSSR